MLVLVEHEQRVARQDPNDSGKEEFPRPPANPANGAEETARERVEPERRVVGAVTQSNESVTLSVECNRCVKIEGPCRESSVAIGMSQAHGCAEPYDASTAPLRFR